MASAQKPTFEDIGTPKETPPDVLTPGTEIGQYTVTELIAKGGGGTVYGAVHRETGGMAAVKVLHASLIKLPKMSERFQREVLALSSLRHPNIVEVWEVGSMEDGRPFFAMERLSGRPISKMLESVGRLLPTEAVEIFEPVCSALSAAHSAGIVHRDIKPSNIMITDGSPGVIKLLDFGVAKLNSPAFGSSMLTTAGRMVGTPGCMAPEQIFGREVDARTDIYALGVLLYRLLTGHPPFTASSILEQIQHHLEKPAPRPSLRAPAAATLDRVVLRCMEKNPSQRYASIDELISDLHAAMHGPIDSLPPRSADLGVAIYLEIRAKADDTMDIGLADTVGFMLDCADDMMRDAGMVISFTTGNEVLGVLPLSVDSATVADEVARVVRTARELRQQLDKLKRDEQRIHANVCVHVDRVLLKLSSTVEVLGGELVRTDRWAPRAEIRGVGGTSTVIARLPNGAELLEAFENED